MTGTDVEVRRAGGIELPEGLEDVESTDLQMPIIRINHKNGTWVNSLSGEESDELEVILLGLMKQRILWPQEVSDDGDPPLCQSLNFTVGRPTERFPVKASGFSKDAVADAIPDPDTGLQDDGAGLACKDCVLKDWGSHPSRDVPWCSEMHTYPLVIVHRDDEGVIESLERAVLSVSKTGIKPSKAYVTSFVSRKVPLYTAMTTLALKQQTRGTVEYAVPVFKKTGDTDPTEFPELSAALRAMKNFLLTPRAPVKKDEDEDEAPVRRSAKAARDIVERAAPAEDDDGGAPPPRKAGRRAAPVPVGADGDAPDDDETPPKATTRAAPVPDDDDDEEPF